MGKREYLFTSESVTEGHPDKVADQISDAILDALLKEDPRSRVACETLVTTGVAIIAGEITTKARLDYQDIVRETIKGIGYTDASMGFDYKTCAVMVTLARQSPPDVTQAKLREGILEEVIRKVVPAELLTSKTKYHINPTGQFIVGGPHGDCGLTGREIIVDTHGGPGSPGGGGLSGQDPPQGD